MEHINLFYPTIYKDEWLRALEGVFSTRWIGQGTQVDEFERQFAQKFGYEYCLAVNSGSAALELAYHLADIGVGDEVITPVFTCTATNIPLLRRKAKIVFADIDDNLLISYDDVKRKLSKNTKAIVVATIGGLPVDERIFALGVPVIIDAAQSVGVSEKFGDYICYSFQAIKHFTTGDGGMLVLRDWKSYERAKRLRWFGIDREAKRRVDFRCLNNREITMEIEEAGYKYHMNDIAASLGLVGLSHTDDVLEYRKWMCDIYVENLPRSFRSVCGGSYWLMAVLTEERNTIIELLRDNNVECDLVQLRNDIFKVFGGKRQDLPNMNYLEDEYLYLPLHTKLTAENVKFICGLL